MPAEATGSSSKRRISGKTRLIGLLGDPIEQARSPALFNDFFEGAQMDRLCVAFHVGADGLASCFAGLRELANLDAVLVTTPHKRAIVPMLDRLTETSMRVNAVNVARRDGADGWVGAMFDGEGTVLGLRWENVDVGGKRVLLVGAGGAGRAIAVALARAGAASIAIIDIDDTAAAELAELVRSMEYACSAAIEVSAGSEFDISINASPIGMTSETAMPIQARWLTPGSCLVDLTGEPEDTVLGRCALAAGCRVFGGNLVHQGQAVLAARFLGFDFLPAGRPQVPLHDFADDRPM